jgi:hypothetical protein
MTAAGLPPVDQALLPAGVRTAPPAERSAYEAALGFERVLAGQLAKQLEATAGGDDDQSPYASLIPGALADGIMASGGLGLAEPLAQAISKDAS